MKNRVFLVGYMGSGKSTIGRRIAADLNWQFIDMDTYFETRHACTISEFFAQHGESGFREAEAQVVRDLCSVPNAVIATGGGAPCFHNNMEAMRQAGLTIYIQVEPHELAHRLAPAKAHRPIIANKTDEELEAFVAEQLSGREPFYRKAEMTVDGARTPFSSYKLFVEAFMDFAEDDEQKEGLSLPEETSNTPSITPFAQKSTPDLSNKNIRAALFDLDGVVLDTERQYDIIWGRIGRQYFPSDPEFARKIKGMTLVNIFAQYFTDGFANPDEVQADVRQQLDAFERDEMQYPYIAGAHDFILALRAAGFRTALVTSSNEVKMADVRRAHPDFDTMWDAIVTAELTAHSKPAPDCFLKGAELLGLTPDECVVFEDSQNGMKAGKAAGMLTVGVATTFGRDVCRSLADMVIDDFVPTDDISVADPFAIFGHLPKK